LLIGDTRLVDKPYGRRIWQSLPPMRRTREVSEAIAFFAPQAALRADTEQAETPALARLSKGFI
jgi:hypothetical protein